MPSSITHTYFALDVLDKLDNNTNKLVNENLNIYKIFSSGPDHLCYNPGIYTKLNRSMHREKSKEFFTNTIKYIKDNKLKHDSQVMSFLYGFITHYMLDSSIHPLVYYETGRYIKGRSDRLKYRGKHAIMELTIDEYMIAIRNNIKVNKFKIHDFSFPKIKINDNLKNLMDTVIKETYNIENGSKLFIKSISKARRVHKYIRYDRFGIKKMIYSFLNKTIFKKQDLLQTASYKFNYKNYLYLLNNNKEQWNHPVDKNEILNYSFIELYVIAYKNTIDLINLINKVINGKLKIEKISKLLNKSYLTGKDLEDNRKIQFFSY